MLFQRRTESTIKRITRSLRPYGSVCIGLPPVNQTGRTPLRAK